jgi:hypothetical protein
MLERELVALRAGGPTEPAGLLPTQVPTPVSGPPVATRPVSGPPVSAPPVSGPPVSGPPVSGPPISGSPGSGSFASGPTVPTAEPPTSAPPAGNGDRSMLIGRAPVVARPPSNPSPGGSYGSGPAPPQAARLARTPGDRLRRLKRGGTWSVIGVSFSLVCWIVWAASNRARGIYVAPAAFVGTLAVAAGVFVVLRLLGQLVIEGWMHRNRRGSTGAHFGVAVFLIAVGITYLEQTSWIAKLFGWS